MVYPIGTQYNNVYLPGYNEAYALQELLCMTDLAMEDDLDRMEEDNFTGDHFTICVNGKSIDFMLGGPQVDALYAFIHHICGENLYEINMKTNEVKGW